MTKRIILAAVLLCAAPAAWAQQEVDALKLYIGPASSRCAVSAGLNSPEGSVVGSPCDEYWRIDGSTGTPARYYKLTGTATTSGWIEFNPASIAWSRVSKTGSSLADLATRSAGDLSSGTLADARLSANVPLLNVASNVFTGTMGVGVTPSERLEVGGGSGSNFIKVRSGSTGASDVAGVFATTNNGSTALWRIQGNASSGLWQLGVGSSYQSRLAIVYATGAVGMGTDTPAARLAINGGLHVGGDSDPGDDNAYVDGFVGHPSYVPRASNWRVTAEGAGDFVKLYAQAMLVKTLQADLEIVLAGKWTLSKSLGVVSQAFSCPTVTEMDPTETLWVRDFPSAPNMAVFQANDHVVLYVFSRAGGGLTFGECAGVVTGYADGTGANEGQQSWTFTRGSAANGGGLAAGTVIPVEAVALDWGVSGNGAYQVNAIDGTYGQYSPYAQVVTWTGAPLAANLVVRARFGNISAYTGVANEFGLIIGPTIAARGRYLRASNQTFELHGIDMTLWDGTAAVVRLTPNSGAPYLSLGNPAPTTYAAGTGIWFGKDGAVYKARVGVPGGAGWSWDGTTFAIAGSVYSDVGVIGGFTLSGTEGLYAGAGATRVQMKPGAGFWAGATARDDAPFSVTEGGALRVSSGRFGDAATDVAIDGSGLTVGSTGRIAGGASAFMTGAGFWMGYDAGYYRWRVGDPAGQYIAFNGLGVDVWADVYSDNWSLTNDEGLFFESAGSSSAYGQMVRWDDGSTIAARTDVAALHLDGPDDSVAMNLYADHLGMWGGGAGVHLNDAALYPETNDSLTLGTSTNKWKHLWVYNTAYFGADIESVGGYKVNDGGTIRVGATDSALGNCANGIESLAVYGGIVISASCAAPRPESAIISALREEVARLRALVEGVR